MEEKDIKQEDLNESMNNILKSKMQEAKESKIEDTIQRVVGNYKRIYFFEEFIENMSPQNINSIRSLITNNDRKVFYAKIKDMKSKLEFYKFFDLEWQNKYNDYIKKDKVLNKSIEDNLTLISSTLSIGLKYFTELISIKGYLNKNIDQTTFNAYKNDTFNKITEKYTNTSAEELKSLKNDYELDIAKLCCLADEYYNEFISKLEMI